MIKGSEAQKQRPHKLLWMLWFDEKNISNWCIWLFRSCYAHQKKLNEKIWTPKKMWRIYSCIFFVKMAHCTKITTRCTIPAAQFFQTFKNETLTRGASLTTLTTILFTSNSYWSQHFFFKEKRNFPAICSKLMPSSMRPDSP